MIVYNGFSDVKLNNTAVTIGKFDGLHLGHAALLKEVTAQKLFNRTAVAVNLLMDRKEGLIYSETERRRLFEEAGCDVLIEAVLNKELMSIEAEDFVKDYIAEKLGAKIVVTGYDFAFGVGKRGDQKLLRKLGNEYGFTVMCIDRQEFRGERISSTRIRDCLSLGDMDKAKAMLGREYSLEGEVVTGNRLGRTLGMPTANMIWPQDKLVICRGVYLASVNIDDEQYYGIANVGIKPTIEGRKAFGCETNIFDFDKDIYSRYIRVSFLKHLRDEIRFNNIDELKAKMHMDKKTAKDLLGL